MRVLLAIIFSLFLSAFGAFAQNELVELSLDDLRDKIRGGLLGQILGNLNGIPHEMQYIHEPGSVTDYVPSLPEGARTDDDTDFEWVYIVEMQHRDKLFLSTQEIAQLWRERINRRIWCSNQYARQLMDIDIEPPLTGNVLLNPWAEFNISGQFLCETFGLLGPGMPQTASRLGLNYTRVAIDGEPAQTTQLFNTMIATAFMEDDVDKIIDAGLQALDQKSELRQIIQDVRIWSAANPTDWQTTRRKIAEKYSQVDGAMRDRNGYELNTAATFAALLYGQGDLVETLQHAFNFGWDCDNTAATSGTILGVVQGYKWMLAQGWQIVDRYKNTTRQNMPEDETITSFADRLIDLAEKVIREQGGDRTSKDGKILYQINTEAPRNVAPLYKNENLLTLMQTEQKAQIINDILGENPTHQSRGAYLAICLGLDDDLKRDHSDPWNTALAALQEREQIMQVLFHHSPVPAADALQAKAIAAGIRRPEAKIRLWE